MAAILRPSRSTHALRLVLEGSINETNGVRGGLITCLVHRSRDHEGGMSF